MAGSKNAELAVDLAAFLAEAQAQTSLSGMTQAQITAMQDKLTDFDADLLDEQQKAEAAKAATSKANASAAILRKELAYRRSIIKGDTKLTKAEKEAFGVDMNEPGPRTDPTAPTDLVAAPSNNSKRNDLTWKPNGNNNRTMYIVDFKIGAAGAWQYLESTMRRKLSHNGRTPGETVYYRVKAKRNEVESDFSNEAVVNG